MTEEIITETADISDTTKAVLARLTSKGIICPDCGKVVETILIERSQVKLYKIDYEKSKIVAHLSHEDWQSDGDYAFRCPHCDTLNIDEEVSSYLPQLTVEY